MRYSRQREIIYAVLCGTRTHPDAEWVYAQVKRELPDVSLGTVYRNLKQMAGSGLVATVETADKSLHFDADMSPHQHFVCSRCGHILDLYLESGMLERLRAQGYDAQQEKAVYYGVCNDCLKK